MYIECAANSHGCTMRELHDEQLPLSCSTTGMASKTASPLQNRAWEDFRREVSLMMQQAPSFIPPRQNPACCQ